MGNGAWQSDIKDLKAHLQSLAIPFDVTTSFVGVDYLLYAAAIVPGGNAGTESLAIPDAEEKRLANAVKDGLGYIGHCAGAFLAGKWSYGGLGLVNFAIDYPDFYRNGGAEIQVMPNEIFDGSVKYLLFYGGAGLDGIPNAQVLARYRIDGNASIVQFRANKGLVILTGGHPEVSQATISSLGRSDPDGSDAVLEQRLLNAVVTNQEVQ